METFFNVALVAGVCGLLWHGSDILVELYRRSFIALGKERAPPETPPPELSEQELNEWHRRIAAAREAGWNLQETPDKLAVFGPLERQRRRTEHVAK